MKFLILSLIMVLASCSSKNDDAKVAATRGGDSSQYRGYDLYGRATTCDIPRSDQPICTSEISILIMANRNFRDICLNQGLRAYDCNCEKSFLCSGKLDVLISGYDYSGRLNKEIPHDEILDCPDGGEFTPDGSDGKQEDFRQRCEAAGHSAILVGCRFKRFLCSSKI